MGVNSWPLFNYPNIVGFFFKPLHFFLPTSHLQSEHRLRSLQNKRVDTFCNYPAELVCRASLHSTVHTLRVFPIKTNKTFEDSNTSSIIDNIRFKAAANTNGLLQSMNSLQQLLTNFDDVVQQRSPRGSTGQWQV